jgi:hypothetical protein
LVSIHGVQGEGVARLKVSCKTVFLHVLKDSRCHPTLDQDLGVGVGVGVGVKTKD